MIQSKFKLFVLFILGFGLNTNAQVNIKNPGFYTVSFKGVNYVIPLLAGYNYYKNSVFSKTPIEHFTQSYVLNNDEYSENNIVDFTELIPDDLENNPTINVHGLKVLLEMECGGFNGIKLRKCFMNSKRLNQIIVKPMKNCGI